MYLRILPQQKSVDGKNHTETEIQCGNANTVERSKQTNKQYCVQRTQHTRTQSPNQTEMMTTGKIATVKIEI